MSRMFVCVVTHVCKRAERCHIVYRLAGKGIVKSLVSFGAIVPGSGARNIAVRMHFLIPLTTKSLTPQPHNSSRLRFEVLCRFAPLRVPKPHNTLHVPTGPSAPLALRYRRHGVLQVDAHYDTASHRHDLLLCGIDLGLLRSLSGSSCRLFPHGLSPTIIHRSRTTTNSKHS